MADSRQGMSGGSDEWIGVVLVLCAAVVAAVWSGAQAAAVVSGNGTLPVGLGDAMKAMINLPQTAAEPALAWPDHVQGSVPGPWLYWPISVVVAVVEIGGLVWLILRIFSHRIGLAKRSRLGLDPNARFAAKRDLRTLIVNGPVKGRLILGTVDGHLVATENRRDAPTLAPATTRLFAAASKQGALDPRQGDRSAVAVIGPTRSGKTVNVVSGILDWDGPAILSSVRNDLVKETFARRHQVGDCFIFDPAEALTDDEVPEGAIRVGWSPLQAATTVSGAMRVGHYLQQASPMEGTTNANYFEKKSEALLWPTLYAAAIGDRTMADVVRWLNVQDGNEPDESEDGQTNDITSESRTILLAALERNPNSAESKEAGHALAGFDGFWKLDPKARSDIFSTAQTLVQPWEDPLVSFSSALGHGYGRVGDGIDLKMLLRGRNTLYVVQPVEDVDRFAVVFGGVLGSLLKDQSYRISNRSQEQLPNLLVVVDEAGNTPLQWLPAVASTCSGVGVQLVTVWQSKAQIDAIYQKQADPLLTNHGTKIFFAGASDRSSLEYASYLAGEEEVQTRSANADVHLSASRRSVADSTTQRKLITPDLLRQVMPMEGLILHGTLPPAHLKSRPYWAESRLSKLAAGDGPKLPDWEISTRLTAALEHQDVARAEVMAHIPTYIPNGRTSVQPPVVADDRDDLRRASKGVSTGRLSIRSSADRPRIER